MSIEESFAANIVPVLAIALGIVCAIICVLAGVWAKVRTVEQNAALKLALLNSGMSAEDIIAVVNAGNRQKVS